MGLGREGRKRWAPSSRKGQLQKPKASLKYFPRFSFLPSPSSQLLEQHVSCCGAWAPPAKPAAFASSQLNLQLMK